MSDFVRSQCRLPRELNNWLTERAKHESRSKNAQLIVELCARRAEVAERGLTSPCTNASTCVPERIVRDSGVDVCWCGGYEKLDMQ